MSDGDILANAGETPHEVRVGRVLNAFLDRRARGRSEPEQQLFEQHPNLACDLRLHLDTLRELKPERGQIAALIQQGLLCNSDDPAYPARLGPFKVSRVLGHGGMGVVLRAYEESLDREVALKLLRPELTHDKRALRRFTREAKALAAINHPNIVTIHAVGEESGVHYLAMELVEGPTLADVIRVRGPLPTESVRPLFRQLLGALAAAYEAGLIHRDVKSSNVLLDGWEREGSRDQGIVESTCVDAPAPRGDYPPATPTPNTESSPSCLGASVPACLGRLKLADFGLARMISSQTRLTRADSPLGTPEYMSPEQARGDEDVDHRSDLYSAGVVLYEMLTGRTPFKADTSSAVIHQILHSNPADPRKLYRHVDRPLASLALRLMAKSPTDRLESACAARATLEADRPVASRERRRRTRRRLTWASIVVTVVGAMMVGVWPLLSGLLPITAVRPDPDFPNKVQVQYAGIGIWRQFEDFGRDTVVNAVELFDVDLPEKQILAIGFDRPWGKQRTLLAWLDRDRNMIGRTEIYEKLPWPDVEAGPTSWTIGALIPFPSPDDSNRFELLVDANHRHEYPTRLIRIDPRTGEILASFRHFGQLSLFAELPAYFEDGHSAILFVGTNNKMDGFGDPPYPGDRGYHEYTKYSKVWVVMILDPLNMEGLGPPYVADLGLPAARPVAYAILDCPTDTRIYVLPDGSGTAEPSAD